MSTVQSEDPDPDLRGILPGLIEVGAIFGVLVLRSGPASALLPTADPQRTK